MQDPRPVLGEDGILPGTPAARDAAALRKKFPGFSKDLAREAQALRIRSCLPPDVPIPGTAGRAFKRRVRNSDSNEGKRGGYRLVYGVFPEGLVFLRLYSKRDTADVASRELLHALAAVQERLDALSAGGDSEPGA